MTHLSSHGANELVVDGVGGALEYLSLYIHDSSFLVILPCLGLGEAGVMNWVLGVVIESALVSLRICPDVLLKSPGCPFSILTYFECVLRP